MEFAVVVSPLNNLFKISVAFKHLNLTLNVPFSKRQVPYFPCNGIANGNFVLGRVFLQDALSVDITITPMEMDQARNYTGPNSAPSPSPAPNSSGSPRPPDNIDSDSSASLASGAITGIAIGTAATVVIIAGLAFWRISKNAKRSLQVREVSTKSSSPRAIADMEFYGLDLLSDLLWL
ncbi:hypothetical protein HD806DRAFT_551421 [Xylariaceae sp. AK1471]|nr:hypothetical protein HD806DRAFT_551421 [Xylariaceae sp. AK1471]